MTTSQKHRCFINEPMGDKPVMDVAGIGTVLGTRLQEIGCDKAYKILGQYLLLERKKSSFKSWLKGACGANAKQSEDCYHCIDTWWENYCS